MVLFLLIICRMFLNRSSLPPFFIYITSLSCSITFCLT